ncbi:MAG: hypothetical protein VR72_19945 [Clostridiaceae bacterium BRH_c20a]|nr:MAG: hypothetical protein VR72_19945 [Clostridiaceae bacterium BRH_c20a]
MEYVIQSIASIFDPITLLLTIIGTAVGVILGAMPGLNGPIGVALLLPFTFNLDPAAGLLMLGGIYMGSNYGGSISAILLNTPGTEVAACTALEGFPLAQQGRAKEALYYSISACIIGGFIGVIVLIFFTPILAKVALKFGPPEMFLMAMAGMAVVGSLTGKNIYKGLFAAAFGILLSTIGPDIMSGTERLSFGINQLKGGIPLIPAMIGLFAINEMLCQLGSRDGSLINVPFKEITFKEVFLNLVKKPLLVIKSSLLGTFIGILPGTGGAIATFIVYGEAKRSSKNPELFGKGCIDGIIAPESANNAAVGGSLVPLLALGIPGSATAAILYGALTIHGLIPGPRLFQLNPQIVYTFMIGMLVTVFIMGLIGIYGVPYFSKILKIKLKYIIPIVLSLCIFGAYSIRNNLFDVLLAIVFGLIGYVLRQVDIPIAPIVLGIILGPLAEENFRQSLSIAKSESGSLLQYFIMRPISIIIFILLLLLIYTNVKAVMRSENQEVEL